MTRRFEKKRPPFITLPRHKRSDEVIRLKGRMKRDSDEYGGMFTSHLVLDEPGRPDLYSQWFDFYFPGLDRFTIWNAAFVTARKAFWDAAHELAYQRTAAMLTPEEHSAESNMEFEPAEFSNTGKVLSYRLIERKKMQYEKFGGLTFFEQWEKLESEIVREAPPTIHEFFRLDRSYAYGVGLYIVLDVNVIDRTAIEQAITKFRAIGETDWQAVNPVPSERLPVVSEKEALAAINCK
ncbi:MAG: hypothetical protein Q7T40_05600 [Methylobacter sp.]|nr:hypothetical protein [Methylobacter sp.]